MHNYVRTRLNQASCVWRLVVDEMGNAGAFRTDFLTSSIDDAVTDGLVDMNTTTQPSD